MEYFNRLISQSHSNDTHTRCYDDDNANILHMCERITHDAVVVASSSCVAAKLKWSFE